MGEERLSREDAERLEAEIRDRRKREFKEALVELMREHPREIYAAVLEVMKLLREDAHRALGRRIEQLLVALLVLAIVGLGAIGYWWTHR